LSEKEIKYIAQFIDKKRVVTQVSWGGALQTPSIRAM